MHKGNAATNKTGYSSFARMIGQSSEELLHTKKMLMTAGWTISWCQEDCFKHTGSDLRTTLSLHARNMGVKLRPFKKVTDFLQWSSQGPHPCVLFTSWRAAKPCITAITSPGLENRIMFTVVLCMDMVQQRRAEHWVSNLMKSRGHHFPVEVTTPDLLKQVLQVHGDCLDESALLQREARCAFKQALPPVQMETLLPADASQRARPKMGVQTTKSTLNFGEKAAIAISQDDWPKVTHGIVDPNVAHVWADPVVANVWSRLQCPERVRHALMASTPDTYED